MNPIRRKYVPQRLFNLTGLWSGVMFYDHDVVAKQLCHSPLFDMPPQVTCDLSKPQAEIHIDGRIGKGLRGGGFIPGADVIEALYQFEQSSCESLLMIVDVPAAQICEVDKIAEWVMAIRRSRKVDSLIQGHALGGGYWLAAMGESVHLSSRNCRVGGLGVSAIHRDISQAEAMAGEKTTEIAAGKFKTICSQHAPLSREGASVVQEDLDYVFSNLCHDVALLRGLSPVNLMSLQGKVLIGDRAIAAGLADGYWQPSNQPGGS